MNPQQIRTLLEQVRDGGLTPDQGLERLKHLPFEDLGYARVDHHRTLRVGFPEVIFGRGKTSEQVVGIVKSLLKQKSNILVTRTDGETFKKVRRVARKAEFHEAAHAITVVSDAKIYGEGIVYIVCAGTSDIPVAEEAALTSRLMGNDVRTAYDVGVAGIHRLLSIRDALTEASVVIVVAGMEGALASVVGGLLSVPVIAVPTSIGYGSNFGGLSALLAMLNSCASNVVTVNIDNGFGAGYVASLINRKRPNGKAVTP
ncbi:MAG: nickel pincer cofactor biosynthesis protein LarB [Acidobacteriota bacterium]|jgi:NCAIR mutase (PurE)-related protein|nr:nickel pincer cofactor biosynthesis protein LarB [Acidobacteriota bacterium]